MQNLYSENVYNILQKSYDSKKLVHAYLFFGGNAETKMVTAKKFASLILKADEKTTDLIDREEHANVVIIRPDGKNIKKEQIVFLKKEISKKSIENNSKIYIIEDAHLMSSSATNSLLKFLEEPADDTYIILIAPAKENLLATIISRTSNLNFTDSNSDKIYNIEKYSHLIEELERKTTLPFLVANIYPEIFKNELPEFITTYQQYLHDLNTKFSNEPMLLVQNVKKIRALEVASRNLRNNMNIQLVLDVLWQNFE